MPALDLGFVALTDAAPLIVAQQRGFFEAEGLRVTLRREVSWATIRDKVAAGMFEGAHMLAPAALALTLGAGSEPANVIVPLSLNTHGASVGVSKALADEIASHDMPFSAAALAEAAARRRSSGARALTFAVVFPYAMHNYMLRAWAAAAGLDTERDLLIVVAPPTAIADRLRSGEIDGFSVGAPWAAKCERESGACVVLEAADFWPGGPDKVLGLSSTWATREPGAAQALTRAVLRAAIWADAPENRADLVQLLALPDHVGAPEAYIAEKLGAEKPHIRFARDHAAIPWTEHACWIVSQMVRWRQVSPHADFAQAISVYRRDMFDDAARAIGLQHPAANEEAPRLAVGIDDSAAFDLDSLYRVANAAKPA